MWNHVVKNFQVKHGRCDSIIFPKTFSFESSKSLLDLYLANSRILSFWQVLECIHEFIIELHALQRRGSIISNFTKKRLFHLLWLPSALGGNLTMWPPFLHPPKNTFLSPSIWSRRDTWTLNTWKESLLICLEYCQGVPYSHRQSRNRMMNFFIKVNITATWKK